LWARHSPSIMEPLWFRLVASVKELRANPAFELPRNGLGGAAVHTTP